MNQNCCESVLVSQGNGSPFQSTKLAATSISHFNRGSLCNYTVFSQRRSKGKHRRKKKQKKQKQKKQKQKQFQCCLVVGVCCSCCCCCCFSCSCCGRTFCPASSLRWPDGSISSAPAACSKRHTSNPMPLPWNPKTHFISVVSFAKTNSNSAIILRGTLDSFSILKLVLNGVANEDESYSEGQKGWAAMHCK